jgi:GTP-binding protein
MNTSLAGPSGRRKPTVAIVGRPNVGKSTLFNRLIGRKKVIVEDIPGVTRDRIYADCHWDNVDFTLVDTGGFDPQAEDFYLSLIKTQTMIAIEEADLILFVMDSSQGVMPQDREVLDVLRKASKPVLYVLNKVDHEKHADRVYEFHSLGIDRFHQVSALQGRNIYDLLDAIAEHLPKIPVEEEEGERIRVALIGKPNVGKSTLINRILGEERLLVSPLPGTTRDSVDTLIVRDGKSYVFIDTAGVRRRAKVTLPVERYSVLRTIRSIEHSDVVLLLVDCTEGPTHQDAHLAEIVERKGKASIIVLNKWDLLPRELAEKPGIEDEARARLKAIHYSPVITISALTGKRVHKLFDMIDGVYSNYSRRFSTGALNKILANAARRTPPPRYLGRDIKFYYITQLKAKPPTFVLFTNAPEEAVPESYRRYIENSLRGELELSGTSVKLILRSRASSRE